MYLEIGKPTMKLPQADVRARRFTYSWFRDFSLVHWQLHTKSVDAWNTWVFMTYGSA
jgi:hypothetical protein